MAEHFLTKTGVDLDQCLAFGGGLALEAYPALYQALLSKAGEDIAALFAEPLLSRGNDQAPPSVSWYTDIQGTAQPFKRLDETQQKALSSDLSSKLRKLRDLLDDPDDGVLIGAALHLADAGDIWAIDGTPVLINWGILPAGMLHDATARSVHYAQTLGRFLPLGAAPPLSAAEQNSRATAAVEDEAPETGQGASGAPHAAVATGAAVAAEPLHERKTQVGDHGRVPVWSWLPLVVLLLLAGGVLAWLLIPGNRIFPASANDRAISDDAVLAAAVRTNRALEQRLAELQDALSGAVCTDEGMLLMPDGHTIEGLLPPDPNDHTDVPGAIRPADRTAILPPDPERVRVADAENPQETASLLTHIEERTAIVLAQGAQGLSSGTGFFVGPDLLVTNFHVIADSGVNAIYVTNNDLGGLQQADVLKTMGPFDATGGDFALLRVPGANQPAFRVLDSQDSLRLQSVIAAGYPGDLLESDAQFQQLKSGDRTAVPELAVTDGTVSAQQVLDGRARVVFHSAPISTGNSGGPLIDMCGRLVGVNTFVKQGAMRNLNIALSTSDLLSFLGNSDALPLVVTQPCAPQIQRPIAPVAAATVPIAVPEPAPGTGDAGSPGLPALTPRTE